MFTGTHTPGLVQGVEKYVEYRRLILHVSFRGPFSLNGIVNGRKMQASLRGTDAYGLANPVNHVISLPVRRSYEDRSTSPGS